MKNNQILKNFLIMFVCYLIDSVINYFIPTNINRSGLTFVPCIGLLMFSLLTITVHDKSERFFFSAACGLYYTVCYSNSLMVYILIYCAITFVRTYIYRNDNMTCLEFIVYAILIVTFKEFVVYWLMLISRFTYIGVIQFVTMRYLPTLVMNVVFAPIVYLVYKQFNIYIEPNDFDMKDI